MLLRLRLEAGVLVEDLVLKLLQRRGRLDPDLVVEHPSESLIGVESLRLTSVAVQGENQESVQPLAERVLRRQCLDLADHVAMASTAQVGLDSILQTAQAQLLEAGGFYLGERLRELGQRRAPPQLERG